MSLGFRKNDYRGIDSEQTDSFIDDNFIDYSPNMSEITEQHDVIWDIWNDITEQIDQLGVPILDKCDYTDFLYFIVGDNLYSE